MDENISGEPQGGAAAAPKGKRFAAGAIDLIVIPIILGLLLGFLMVVLNIPEGGIRETLLILANIVWLLVRDTVYSPGRAMIGLKLVSLTGEKVTLPQAAIRNILLIIPFVLLIGYIVEIISLFSKGERVADSWAKTRVVLA